ncbi:MAG: hypothetical protein ACTSSJ_01790 [Candidatus Odinarchaeia archaeon]
MPSLTKFFSKLSEADLYALGPAIQEIWENQDKYQKILEKQNPKLAREFFEVITSLHVLIDAYMVDRITEEELYNGIKKIMRKRLAKNNTYYNLI